MSGYTKGPWVICNTSDIFTNLGAENAEGTNAPSNDGWMIADCDMGGLSLAEVKANSHLISAAPDLFDQLTWAVNNPDDSAYWLESARAAIAKARGES